jgi:hypothetical protein
MKFILLIVFICSLLIFVNSEYEQWMIDGITAIECLDYDGTPVPGIDKYGEFDIGATSKTCETIKAHCKEDFEIVKGYEDVCNSGWSVPNITNAKFSNSAYSDMGTCINMNGSIDTSILGCTRDSILGTSEKCYFWDANCDSIIDKCVKNGGKFSPQDACTPKDWFLVYEYNGNNIKYNIGTCKNTIIGNVHLNYRSHKDNVLTYITRKSCKEFETMCSSFVKGSDYGEYCDPSWNPKIKISSIEYTYNEVNQVIGRCSTDISGIDDNRCYVVDQGRTAIAFCKLDDYDCPMLKAECKTKYKGKWFESSSGLCKSKPSPYCCFTKLITNSSWNNRVRGSCPFLCAGLGEHASIPTICRTCKCSYGSNPSSIC